MHQFLYNLQQLFCVSHMSSLISVVLVAIAFSSRVYFLLGHFQLYFWEKFQHFLFLSFCTLSFLVSLCVQPKFRKKQTRVTPNTDTFHAVKATTINKLSRSVCDSLVLFFIDSRSIARTEAAPWGDLIKWCSEIMQQQIYRKTTMPKCDFNKVAL